MAQLGNVLRITFTSARIEETAGWTLPRRGSRDQRVRLSWEARRPSGAIADGSASLAEIRHWKLWFAETEAVRALPTRLGKTPADPVARLWTPLAGQTVEFFVWPEATGSLAILALFTPDQGNPHNRIAVETSATPDELRAFGEAIEAEAVATATSLRSSARRL